MAYDGRGLPVYEGCMKVRGDEELPFTEQATFEGQGQRRQLQRLAGLGECAFSIANLLRWYDASYS